MIRQCGLRATPQRRVVLQFLVRRRIHATAEEILEAVNRAVPRASRATVYNVVRDLVCAGLVRELSADGRASRYDARIERHHHFVCDRCGRLEDVEWFDVAPPVRRLKSLAGHTVREYELIMRGACAACSRAD
jgi:Fe2+ or Zn2+ uptake regulation protein